MCYSTGIAWSSDVAIFLSVLVGCVIISCIAANIRLVWLGTNGSSRFSRNLQLSSYLLSCCCSDTILVCIFGPVLCIIFTKDNWIISDTVCAFLDIVFMALFGATTISLLLYNLDRHCLLVRRRFYLGTFGKHKRNAINLGVAWSTVIALSFVFLQNRTISKVHVPMTFHLGANMLYCVLATVILYLIPIFVIITSLIKTKLHLKINSRHFQSNETSNDHAFLAGVLQEDIQSYDGLIASSTVFISTSMPWVLFQIIKALGLTSSVSVMVEVALVTIVVIGIGMKTVAYVICCGFIRKRFFVNIFRENTFTFELPPSPVVIINTAAV